TINSMALNVEEILNRAAPEILDPLDGRSDLEKRIIRADSEESLRRDPVRMLRAFRFAAMLKFSIESGTLDMIRRNKGAIRQSAGERVRSEFFIGLGEGGAGSFLRSMHTAGILEEIFPETRKWSVVVRTRPDPMSLLDHAFRSAEAAENILSRVGGIYPSFPNPIQHHFGEQVEEGISRATLVRFASFLHDSGKPESGVAKAEKRFPIFLDHDQAGERVNASIARRLRLSRRSLRILSVVTRHHMRLPALAGARDLTGRAKYRFWRDLGKEGIDIIFVAIASGMASEDSDCCAAALENPRAKRLIEIGGELLTYYFGEFSRGARKPLLTGEEVMEHLRLPQGEKVGKALERLREAEAEGRIRTREEALEFLKNIDNYL
ncbi:MAG TPA: HD domain-containing protein, partial [Thermodesulfobacteriota bacterium]|nr:HD domain-containing protein [Thermodesulfobacteriota bacterium]